jgi:hypothetical protein
MYCHRISQRESFGLMQTNEIGLHIRWSERTVSQLLAKFVELLTQSRSLQLQCLNVSRVAAGHKSTLTHPARYYDIKVLYVRRPVIGE